MRIEAAGIFEAVKLIILELSYSFEGVGFGYRLLALCSMLIVLPARLQQGSSLFPLDEYRIPFSQ